MIRESYYSFKIQKLASDMCHVYTCGYFLSITNTPICLSSVRLYIGLYNIDIGFKAPICLSSVRLYIGLYNIDALCIIG